MRKFILFMLAAVLTVTACTNDPPKFNFDLAGTLVEATTTTTTNFSVATTNVVENYFVVDTEDTQFVYEALTKEEYPDAYKYAFDKAMAYVPNKANYDIYLSGFLEWKGIKLKVDEHWSNYK